jgi:hypothetical protein
VPGGQAAVAFLEQVKVAPDPQFTQRAGDPGGAQLPGPLLDMLTGGPDLGKIGDLVIWLGVTGMLCVCCGSCIVWVIPGGQSYPGR